MKLSIKESRSLEQGNIFTRNSKTLEQLEFVGLDGFIVTYINQNGNKCKLNVIEQPNVYLISDD